MISRKTFLVSVFVFVVAIAAVTAISFRGVPRVVVTRLENLPLNIGEFKGADDRFQDSVYQVLNADHHVYRHYYYNGGRNVDLYIGYYGTAKGGRSGHKPEACLPGSGWALKESTKAKVITNFFPKGVEVNYILAQKDGVYNVLYFWYQSSGSKVVSSGIQQNLNRLINRVFFNRDDGAFVQISTLSDSQSLVHSQERAKQIAGEIIDLLPRYWPIER